MCLTLQFLHPSEGLNFLEKNQIRCTLMHTERTFLSYNLHKVYVWCLKNWSSKLVIPIAEYSNYVKCCTVHCTVHIVLGNIILDVNCETVTLKGRLHELLFYLGGQIRISRLGIAGTRFN